MILWVTILNQADTVLYSSSDASNAKIIVDQIKMELYIDYGQEDATHNIDGIELENNEFHFSIHHVKDIQKRKITSECKILDENKSCWDYYGNGSYYINGSLNLFTNQPERYNIVEN